MVEGAKRFFEEPKALPPQIRLNEIAAVDAERCAFIQFGLANLEHYCDDLAGALDLFQWSGSQLRRLPHPPREGDGTDIERRRLIHWQFIAMRDGAHTIYAFNEQLVALGKNINKCASVLDRMDTEAKKAATKLFKKNFPSHEAIRHSVGHSGELFGTPEADAENAIKGGGLTFINNVFNDEFVTTFKGKRVSYALSSDTLRKLAEVRDLYWSAFAPISYAMPDGSGP